MSRLYSREIRDDYGPRCLIQSLECRDHGVREGNLLRVQKGEAAPTKVRFNGTDQDSSTEFRTEIVSSKRGVVTCIRWNLNPEYCLAASSDGRVTLEHIGNNQTPMHLFCMRTTSPDSTEFVSFKCLASNMYLQCDIYGKPYMSKELHYQAWFKVLKVEDTVDSGRFETAIVEEKPSFRRMLSHG